MISLKFSFHSARLRKQLCTKLKNISPIAIRDANCFSKYNNGLLSREASFHGLHMMQRGALGTPIFLSGEGKERGGENGAKV
jgi:hypothetical protein